mmetsp:Transcript_12473/g.18641  ORF Transcript_12473/g.18641 Transcript_12473/m.18641 type:complete len:637 (+) Transcript_12473:34-1944(+)
MIFRRVVTCLPVAYRSRPTLAKAFLHSQFVPNSTNLNTPQRYHLNNQITRHFFWKWASSLSKDDDIEIAELNKRKRYRKGSEYGKHHSHTKDRYEQPSSRHSTTIESIPPESIDLRDDAFKYPERAPKDTIHDHHRRQHREDNLSGIPFPSTTLEKIEDETEAELKKQGKTPVDVIHKEGPTITSTNDASGIEKMAQHLQNDIVHDIMSSKQSREVLRYNRYLQSKVNNKERFLRGIRESKSSSVSGYYTAYGAMTLASAIGFSLMGNSMLIGLGFLSIIGGSLYMHRQSFSNGVDVAKQFHGRPCQNRVLLGMFNDLLKRAGLENTPPKLYIVNSEEKNAFAAGNSPETGVVVLTTGLIEILEEDEIEAVMAHEIGHIINGDMHTGSHIAALISGYMLFHAISRGLFRSMSSKAKSSSSLKKNDTSGGALVLPLFFIACCSYITYGAANIIKLAVSRHREFGADAISIALTGSSRGLHRALTKISDTSLVPKIATSYAVPITTNGPSYLFSRTAKDHKDAVKVDLDQERFNHLYISPRKIFQNLSLFNTHPPVETRQMIILGYEDLMNQTHSLRSMSTADGKPYHIIFFASVFYCIFVIAGGYFTYFLLFKHIFFKKKEEEEEKASTGEDDEFIE